MIHITQFSHIISSINLNSELGTIISIDYDNLIVGIMSRNFINFTIKVNPNSKFMKLSKLDDTIMIKQLDYCSRVDNLTRNASTLVYSKLRR